MAEMLDEIDDEEWIRRQLEQSGGTVGDVPTPPMEAPSPMAERAKILASMPELTAMPARVDLTEARASDRQQGQRRALETAARQAIGGLTLTKPADTIAPEGNAEANALADETRTRSDVLETRRGQMMERQRALQALLRPPGRTLTPEELALKERSVAAQEKKTEAYGKSVDNVPVMAREKAEAKRLAALAAAARAKEKAAEKAAAAAAKDAKGKTLPSTTVEGIADLPVAEAQIDEMVNSFGRLKMGGLAGKSGSFVSKLPGVGGELAPDSTEYQAIAKIGMQSVGKILEGGKLAAGDELKYAAMLPKGGDTPEVVESKRGHLKAFMRALVSARAQGLKESGYNVPPQFLQSGGAPPAQQSTVPAGRVRMVGPSGVAAMVEPADVEEFRQNGYK